MDVIGYIALSPLEALADPIGFDRDGMTVARQQYVIEAWARARRATIVHITHDVDLASSDAVEERIGLGQAMEMLGPAKLVVARLDRLAADVAIQELLIAALRRAGSDVVSADRREAQLLADPPSDPVRAAIRHAVAVTPEVQGALRSVHAKLNMRRLADTRDASVMADMDHVGEGGMMLDDLARVLNEQRLKRRSRASTRGWPRWWLPARRSTATPR